MPIVIAIFIVIGTLLAGNSIVNHQAKPVVTEEVKVEAPSPSPTSIPTPTPTIQVTPTPIPIPTTKPPPSERAVRAATFMLSIAPEKLKNDFKNIAEQEKTDVITYSARILDSNSSLLVQIESIEQQIKDKNEAAHSQALQNLYSNMNTYRPLANPPIIDPYKDIPLKTSIHCSTYYGTGYSSSDCY